MTNPTVKGYIASFGAVALLAACSASPDDDAAMEDAGGDVQAAAAAPAEIFPDTEEFAACFDRQANLVTPEETARGKAAQFIYGFHTPADPLVFFKEPEEGVSIVREQFDEQFSVDDVNQKMARSVDPSSAYIMVGPEWSYVLYSPAETTTNEQEVLGLKRACARETEDFSLQLVTTKRSL